MKKILVTAEIEVPDEVQVDRVRNYAKIWLRDGKGCGHPNDPMWYLKVKNVKAKLLKKGLHV